MKKTLIALAAVAVSSAAMAQVTIGGVFNVDSQNTTKVGDNVFRMGDAIVRFSVDEDLGAGLKFSANTTIQTNAGRAGTATGNGYAATLSGGFGAITLQNYLRGSSELALGVSADMDMEHVAGGYATRTRLNYALPQIVKGLSVQVRWDKTSAAQAFAKGDETKPDTPAIAAGANPTGAINPTFDADNTKFSVGYAQGAMTLGAAGNFGAVDDASLYAGYNFGVAKVDLGYGQYGGGHTEFTVVVPMGAVTAGLHTMNSDTNSAYAARVAYALSKRTNLSFNYVNASKGAATGDNYRVRLAHSF